MKRTEYNEVYGFLPEDIINNLSDAAKMKLMAMFITRQPTATGWFIVRTVIAQLGEGFVNYLIDGILETINENGEEADKENVVDILTAMMGMFAADTNILTEAVRDYRTEILKLDDNDLEDVEVDPLQEEVKKPKRDSRGRFVKE